MRILVADDDRVARHQVCKLLRKQGQEVLEAEDGTEALRLLETEPVSVLITDWKMPGLSGLDLCRHVRPLERESYLFVVVMTTSTEQEDYLQAIEAGADDFLSKPISLFELNARLRVAERIQLMESEVSKLRGMLTICPRCKQVHGENQQWQQAELYLVERSDANFSHGICPECFAKHFA